jgi:hypothetical protein
VVTVAFPFNGWITYFKLWYIFWMVGNRVLIFHMSVHCDKTFLWVPTDLTMTLVIDRFTKNVNLGYIIWMVCTRNFIWMSLWQDLSIAYSHFRDIASVVVKVLWHLTYSLVGICVSQTHCVHWLGTYCFYSVSSSFSVLYCP